MEKKKKIKSDKPAKKRRIPESELPPSVLKKRKRRRRRIKFLISLLILLSLAVAAFFMGWIHPRLESDQIAVVTNKIKKTQDFYEPDRFTWEWSGLIPGNIRIDIYDISDRRFSVTKSGTLPSGEFYARYVAEGHDNDFDYSIDLDIVYRLKEEYLISLIEERRIHPVHSRELILDGQDLREKNRTEKASSSQADVTVEETTATETDDTGIKEISQPQADSPIEPALKARRANRLFYNDFEADAASQLYSFLHSRSSSNEFVTRLGLDSNEMENQLGSFIEENHPEVEVVALVVNRIHIPDYELYEQIKALVRKDLKPSQAGSLGQQITQSNESRIANDNRIEALKELGKVLSDYPILMDYLKIYAETDKDLDLLKLPQ